MYCIETPLYRCRYEVNPGLVPELEANGMEFVGKDETGERMEILELEDNPPQHPFYLAVQVAGTVGGEGGEIAGG